MNLLLDAFLGLGVPEVVVIAVAIILLLEPKNIVYLKPLIKAGYKAWLAYKREVEDAQREMEGVKHTILEPIEDAKREAEMEAGAIKGGTAEARQAVKAVAGEIQSAKKEALGERESGRRKKVSG